VFHNKLKPINYYRNTYWHLCCTSYY